MSATVEVGVSLAELIYRIDAYRVSRESRRGRRTTWQARAACRGVDAALFYPARGGSAALAREFCRRCPVREACLTHALAFHEKEGIWGGTSARQRRRLRREIALTRRSAA